MGMHKGSCDFTLKQIPSEPGTAVLSHTPDRPQLSALCIPCIWSLATLPPLVVGAAPFFMPCVVLCSRLFLRVCVCAAW